MTGINLLILAVFVILARCQQKPQVSMSPSLKEIFSGDLFFLRCDNSKSGSGVKWYFNNMEQTLRNETWKIGAAAPQHSGSYQCESNGQKSNDFSITVLDYIPIASLTIKTGQPVVRTEGSVILQLDNEDGLQGWNCWVYREGHTKKMMLRLKNDSVSVVFQPKRLNVSETIFWCSDNQQNRSNQITVRTSEKAVSLEMYPQPAVVGESLTLKCLAWGTDQISRTVFFKDNVVIQDSDSPVYKISNVTESEKGTYKCDATFTYRERTSGTPYKVLSDDQDVFVQTPAMKAVLSVNTGMSCSCPLCPAERSYHWYYKTDGQSWALMDSKQGLMTPKKPGIYACRAVWKAGRSFVSNSYNLSVSGQPPITSALLGVVIVLVILIFGAVFFYLRFMKRNNRGPIYEDLPLRSDDKDDNQYEMLQRGDQREGQYNTLHPEAPSRLRKDGEYEALKKDEMAKGEYHTLEMEGAAGKEGGYEALKKDEMAKGEYHTLGMEGADGGE